MINETVDLAVEVFISYETQTGLEYAREARRVLREAGILAWVWEIDSTLGSYPAEEIVEHIKLCDNFLYLCTVQEVTPKWNGQRYERNYAWNQGKRIRVLTFDESYVPDMLQPYKWKEVTPLRFVEECESLAHSLLNDPKLTSNAKFHTEGEQLELT